MGGSEFTTKGENGGAPPHVQNTEPPTSVGCNSHQKIKPSPFPSCLIRPSFNPRLHIGQKLSLIFFRQILPKTFACGAYFETVEKVLLELNPLIQNNTQQNYLSELLIPPVLPSYQKCLPSLILLCRPHQAGTAFPLPPNL